MSIVNLQPKIFACTNSMVLGKKIAASFGIDLGNVITSTYSDGEFQPSYEESIRGTRIFIIASTNPGPENLMELLLMIACSVSQRLALSVFCPSSTVLRK